MLAGYHDKGHGWSWKAASVCSSIHPAPDDYGSGIIQKLQTGLRRLVQAEECPNLLSITTYISVPKVCHVEDPGFHSPLVTVKARAKDQHFDKLP